VNNGIYKGKECSPLVFAAKTSMMGIFISSEGVKYQRKKSFFGKIRIKKIR